MDLQGYGEPECKDMDTIGSNNLLCAANLHGSIIQQFKDISLK